jgi:hypothetical protein
MTRGQGKRVVRFMYHNAGGHLGFQHKNVTLEEVDIVMVGEKK